MAVDIEKKSTRRFQKVNASIKGKMAIHKILDTFCLILDTDFHLNTLIQCFPTGVPQRSVRGAAKNF
jgi:hypothetical protein